MKVDLLLDLKYSVLSPMYKRHEISVTVNYYNHNGSAVVFCPGDCPFESKPSPTSVHACGEMTGCILATKRLAHVAPEVNLRECNITFARLLQKVNKAEPTLALKPRGDVTRNPKQGYQWPPKKDMCPPKTFLTNYYNHLVHWPPWVFSPGWGPGSRRSW